MKRLIIGTAAAAVIGLLTLQFASAGPGRGPGFGFGGDCPNWGAAGGCNSGPAVDQKKVDAFLEETTPLRTQMIDKRAEYQKLTLTNEYDRDKASELTDEIAQIRNQIREKAETAGLNNGNRRGAGCGNGGNGGNWGGRSDCGNGPGSGRSCR